ncbi:L,D-transpeptidase family protein [Novosphingobium sp.]|uniref:L,D-transpeptidase family protein n=1 Tax=Novosphingobium sp. TaxID=1874826 RepID=UPI002606B258|nr:L,D-transpeptidase family protein [Novosphingobium sp.]
MIVASLLTPASALAQRSAPASAAPVDLTKPIDLTKQVQPSVPAAPAPLPPEVAAPVAPEPVPLPHWTQADAQALLVAIKGIGKEGLFPKDYQPEVLSAAIVKGEGPALDETATRLFSWLIEDLRDGRTPMTARVQWFAVDPDQDMNPTQLIIASALEKHDIKGALDALLPTHPDYAALKDALPKATTAKQSAQIRANMDRWRWLARDLGTQYLLTNVPEQMLRLTVRNRIIKSYKVVVGKPGRTATPQLAETVEGVIFNPTWTVPQSIVVGEGLGARLVNNPKQAEREGYKVTKTADGTIYVVQQPGDNNSLGRMKLDMPNEHAIFLHDTPSKAAFNQPVRALSHGCIRVEGAVELAMTMGILGAAMTPEDVALAHTSKVYTKIPMTKTFPVYITYFTVARDVNGTLRSFTDVYNRDAPVIASLAKPRELHTTQRKSTEEVIKLDNPL